jgi:hypothetical protein
VDIRKTHVSESTRHNFGKRDPIELVAGPGPAASGEALAAWIQHRVCVAANRRLKLHGSSMAGLADALYLNTDTLRRKFRGEDSATLAELLTWCVALGILHVWVEITQDIAAGKLPPVAGPAGRLDLEPLTTLRLRPLPPERKKS